jgi:peptide/nickel transport system permease protein
MLLFLTYQLIPGDPALQMIAGNETDFSAEEWAIEIARAREMLGLDYPLHVRYWRWISNIAVGEFGFSMMFRRPVIDVIRAPMLNTVVINIFNIFFVFSLTIPAGIAAAVRRGKAFDQGVQVLTSIGISIPTFLLALLLIWLFPITLGIFPISGMATPNFQGTTMEFLLDRAYFMALPLMAMVLSSMAGLTRFVRASMAEALTMDYVRTARSKGLIEKTVVYSHAFRNSLIPLITVMTGWIIGGFGGTVVLERMFSWNGMGNIMLQGLVEFDFALVQTMQLFYVLIALVGLLIMDLAYGLADPIVRVS